MLLPIMMHSQVLSSLGVAKEITKGTLPNGVEYYLVQNTSDKGFAEICDSFSADCIFEH